MRRTFNPLGYQTKRTSRNKKIGGSFITSQNEKKFEYRVRTYHLLHFHPPNSYVKKTFSPQIVYGVLYEKRQKETIVFSFLKRSEKNYKNLRSPYSRITIINLCQRSFPQKSPNRRVRIFQPTLFRNSSLIFNLSGRQHGHMFLQAPTTDERGGLDQRRSFLVVSGHVLLLTQSRDPGLGQNGESKH